MEQLHIVINIVRETGLDQFYTIPTCAKQCIDTDELISRFHQLDYSISLNTARQNSMGKTELVNLYQQYLSSHIKKYSIYLIMLLIKIFTLSILPILQQII